MATCKERVSSLMKQEDRETDQCIILLNNYDQDNHDVEDTGRMRHISDNQMTNDEVREIMIQPRGIGDKTQRRFVRIPLIFSGVARFRGVSSRCGAREPRSRSVCCKHPLLSTTGIANCLRETLTRYDFAEDVDQ